MGLAVCAGSLVEVADAGEDRAGMRRGVAAGNISVVWRQLIGRPVFGEGLGLFGLLCLAEPF
ncbi:hypothetical protein GCM10010446_48180 [Streptomyces enissocaesilis]|uniref:Uncharacterized protein n=1 Tax=Streptomyces enissocaesilis TaxID=332589 RepID=A0ABP6K2B4_9ACTN